MKMAKGKSANHCRCDAQFAQSEHHVFGDEIAEPQGGPQDSALEKIALAADAKARNGPEEGHDECGGRA